MSKLCNHTSYRDKFGLRYAMFKKDGETLPAFQQTDFVVGNGIIRARMAQGCLFNPRGNLTNINIVSGSHRHPYYEPPCFIAASSNQWNWRHSWFYSVRSERSHGWRTLDEHGTREVSISYVLGCAVTKTVSSGNELDVVVYTFTPSGRASVVQVMQVTARKSVKDASVMAHLNPLMPSRPYGLNYMSMGIKDAALCEEAEGDEAVVFDAGGRQVEFSDYRYDLKLAFGSTVKPSASGVGELTLTEASYKKAYDPVKGEVWNCDGTGKAGPGNVYSSMRYDLGRMKAGETRQLAFAVATGHGPTGARRELAAVLKADVAALLDSSVTAWRRQVGGGEPATELEARFQLGFISALLHRSANGCIEESDGEWLPAVYGRDNYWGLKPFYMLYGNFTERMKQVRAMIQFVHRGWRRYGICDCYFMNEDEQGLKWPHTYTEYPSHYVLMVQDYVRYTGDWSLVKEVWPMMDDCVMTQVKNHLEKGIAPLDIDAHIAWWGLNKQFSKADVKYRMSSAMLLASALDFMADAAKRLGKSSAVYARSRRLQLKAIEKELHPQKNGVYASVSFKDGRRKFMPGFDWAKQIWLGNITGKSAEACLRSIERLPEFKTSSPFDGDVCLTYSGLSKDHVGYAKDPDNVHLTGQTWAYYIESALKLGHAASAKRWVINALKLVSPSGGLAAHYHGAAPELGAVGDYNFLWSGVIFRAVMDYICLVEPLGNGLAEGVRLRSEDLDGIMGVGESLGNAKEFLVTRSGESEVTVRSGSLATQMPGEIEVCSSGSRKAAVMPAAALLKGIRLMTGETLEIRRAAVR